ncbi:uncharacterized protein LOC127733600 [Mytilus californianus]|uniref:uncharacterized protein LOC127733600 n=1 Tax=Mytilus californianus TaxID=6549 RepID=UPI0022480AB8|nr:uncharacterized protein LOC127733600 [Mytilus californianus]
MDSRNEELETASIELYQYMCNVLVGSEKIVRYRRLFFKLFDETWNTQHGFELISSGSKSEGLDLHGSDFDVMTLHKYLKVYENIDSSGFAVNIDTNNAQPGFALLNVPESIGKFCPVLFSKTDNGYLLSSRKIKDLLMVKPRLYNGAFSIHGPSVCHNEVDLDMVYCLQCNTWPFVAKNWLLRNRSSEWPPQELIDNIAEQGVLLVPVGSKSSSNDVNELEWRMSFSLSEKVLIHSFNHVQIICYALLKIYLKEIVNSNKILSKLLCSYYMKTLLFWILEETDGSKWTSENLIHCFLVCVKRLLYFISCNYLPNYFVPAHNMIDGKLSNEARNELIRMLNGVLSDKGWENIFHANSLDGFRARLSFNLVNGYNVFDKAIFPLYMTLEMKYFDFEHKCKHVIHRIVSSLPKSVKNICALQFLCFNYSSLSNVKFCNGDPKCRRAKQSHNKCTYITYRLILAKLLINTYSDAASGWLLLAAFFYNHREHFKMFPLLDLVTVQLSIDRLYLSHHLKTSFIHTLTRKRLSAKCSFLKRLRQEVMKDVPYNIDTKNSFLAHENLGASEIHAFLPCYPVVILHYFSFLIHFELGDNFQADRQLRMLQNTVENTVSGNTHLCVNANTYLMRALRFSNNLAGFHSTCIRVSQIMKQSDEYKTFLEDVSSVNDKIAPLARMMQNLDG